MGQEYPFLYFNHGEPDPDYFGKCEEVFMWFDRPVTMVERKKIVAGCPRPVAGMFTWGDRFVYFGSDGDTYDFEVAATYGSPDFVAALEADDYSVFDNMWEQMGIAGPKFFEAFEAWVREVHELVPITFVYGPNCDSREDPWHKWSVAQGGRALAAVEQFVVDHPWASEGEEAGEMLTEVEKGKGRAPRVDKWFVQPATRGDVAMHYGWIARIVRDHAFEGADDDSKARLVDALYTDDGITAAFGRLTYEESNFQGRGHKVADWLDGATGRERLDKLARLSPYAQLSFLASYAAEKSRILEDLDDAVSHLETLIHGLPRKRLPVVPTLLTMLADNEIHLAPGYSSGVRKKAKFQRAAPIYRMVAAMPTAPPDVFGRAVKCLTKAGDTEGARELALEGMNRGACDDDLGKAVAELAKKLGDDDLAEAGKAALARGKASEEVVQKSFALWNSAKRSKARDIIAAHLAEGGLMTADLMTNYTACLMHAAPRAKKKKQEVAEQVLAIVEQPTLLSRTALLENSVAFLNENGYAAQSIELVFAALEAGVWWTSNLLCNTLFSAWKSGDDEITRRVLAAVDEAEEVQPGILSQQPLNFENRAAIHARMGSLDEAFADIERILTLNPDRRAKLKKDEDLEPLRKDPRWKKLVS